MKTIGILGGMSNVATEQIYRLLNEGITRRFGGHSTAEILMYSVNFETIKRFVHNQLWDESADYLVDKARRLEQGGADFIILVSNTMHIVAPQIISAIKIPFLHIVDATAAEIKKRKLSKVGILGTRTTMQAPFYKDMFVSKHGIELIAPDSADMERIDDIIFNELCRNVLSKTSRRVFIKIMDRLHDQGAEGIILGCTEIFLLVNESNYTPLPLFDTTSIQVEYAIEESLREVRAHVSQV